MKRQILATLSYADIFDYPLTSEEIFRFLIGQHITDNTQQEIEKQLSKNSYLVSHVMYQDGYYCLRGREKIFPIRKQREKWSKEKLKIAERIVGILRFIPWIKLIGITGGLARDNTQKGDDIDLFFITAKNRLWLTRGLIVSILRLLGLYRRPKKIKDMICPNMFVAEEALKMETEDLFTAHEVCLMKPVFEQDNLYQKFLRANLWVEKFLPNAKDWEAVKQWKDFPVSNSQLLITNYTEHLAKAVQLWYMRQRRTTETATDTLIKFHPQDVRLGVLGEYHKRSRSLLTNP